MSKEKKILILGACTNIKNPEKTGGVVVLFENLKKELEDLNIEYHLIDTNKSNYKNIPLAFISIIKDIFKLGRTSSHISLHGTSKDYLYIAIFVLIASKIYGIEYSLRKFAGDFDIYYESLSPISKMVIRYILKKSKYNFFETKNLTKYFSKFNPNTDWFPNVRRRAEDLKPKSDFKRRFVYISHLKDEKGTQELLEACKRLDKSFDVKIYGPIHEDKYTKEYISKFNTNYYGSLSSTEVIEKLKEADVLVLPSHREGYPGVVIEAYSAGRPVLVTNLPAIREIVEDGKTGILVEPKNVDSLIDGFLRFNRENYPQMSQNAFKAFENFNSTEQTKIFLEKISS